MKRLVLVLLLLLAGTVKSQPPDENKYVKIINMYKKFETELFDEKYWQKFKAISKADNSSKKLTEFDSLKQHVLIYSLAQQITSDSEKQQKLWQKEIADFVTSNKKDMTKQDLQNYADELKSIRKNFAVKFEVFVDKMFKDFKNEFTETEIRALPSKIQKNHEKMELIKRDKK